MAASTSDLSAYRYGDTAPVALPFVPGSAVRIGDLCYLTSSGTVQSAGEMAAAGSLLASQEAFAAVFLGVAAQRYDGVNAQAIGIKDGNLMVSTDGVYDMPCASATFTVGQMVAADGNASTFVLDGQQVVATTTASASIGVVVEAATSTTTVRVRLFSNVISARQF